MDNALANITPTEQPSLLALPPTQMVHQASAIAGILGDIIKRQSLYAVIGGKKHVTMEGWSTLGSLLGITAREVSVEEMGDGSYVAVVELFNWKTNQVVGRASSLCGREEKRWGKADRYAVRSMAVTRATGKAYRLCFSWIISLCGYQATPAEEMPFPSDNEKKSTKIDNMIASFKQVQVSVAQIESKIGKPIDEASTQELVDLSQIYLKIKAGAKPGEFFK